MLGIRRWYAIDCVTMPAASAIATVSEGLYMSSTFIEIRPLRGNLAPSTTARSETHAFIRRGTAGHHRRRRAELGREIELGRAVPTPAPRMQGT